MLDINGHEEGKEQIKLLDLIKGMNMLCRSEDRLLDRYIFRIFSTRNHPDKVYRDEMIMMTINLPDMNFGFRHNIKNYYTRQIEDSAIEQVRSVSASGIDMGGDNSPEVLGSRVRNSFVEGPS